MESKIIHEVKDLHQFFQNWFSGEEAEDNFNRLTEVMHEDFKLITPGGVLVQREPLLDNIKQSYKSTHRKIWTEGESVKIYGDFAICTYYELQEEEGIGTKRLSSAIFDLSEGKPVWLHVHEVWV